MKARTYIQELDHRKLQRARKKYAIALGTCQALRAVGATNTQEWRRALVETAECLPEIMRLEQELGIEQPLPEPIDLIGKAPTA